MKRPTAPRPSPSGAELATWAVVGFGTGLAAGFLFAELVGSNGGRFVRLVRALRPRSRKQVGRPALVARVRTALEADAMLAGMPIDVVPGGRQRLELHGWVGSRRQRSHAYNLAVAAAEVPVLNCLLVRGEDDRSPASAHSEGAPRSA
ncbi:MAG TPA: hypothetical protein VFN96_09375 [Gemmatimonadales bacterium]|nr:hypothetical protein [Gemmatimonadales bacterium]